MFVILTLLTGLSAPLFSDEIVLNNGDVLTGTIISMDEQKIIIRTEYGKAEIDRQKIKSGTLTGGFASVATTTIQSKNGKANLLLEMLFEKNLSSTVNNSFQTENKNDVIYTYGYKKNAESALYSKGDGNFIEIHNTKIIDNSPECAISFWAFVNDNSRLQYFISKWTSTEGKKAVGKFAVCTSQNSLYFYIVSEDGLYYSLTAPNILPVHTWTHLLCSFSAGVLSIYVNGEQKARLKTVATGLSNDSSIMYLLTAKAKTDNPFKYYNLNGAMDDLKIFDTIPDADTIKRLAAQAPNHNSVK